MSAPPVLRPRNARRCGPAASAPMLAAILALAVSGCSQFRPNIPQSAGHITTPAAQPAAAAIPPPARISVPVPPPKAQIKPQTYSVVVHEVPVKELLQALARDTKRNIDIHPGISGLVSLNAINETLDAILERVSKQVEIRYRTEGNTIVVSPDTPYSKTYPVDYVNMIRNTSSAIAVSGQVAGSPSGQQQSSSPGGSQSVSAVTTTSAHDFWKTLETTVRSILQSAQSQSREAKAERLSLFKAEQEIRLEEARGRSRSGAGTTGSSATPSPASAAATASPVSQPQTSLNLANDVIANPIAGTLTVSATDAQHRLIQDYLTRIQRSTQRQVLIEATIVEVALTNAYQSGIDFSRLAGNGISFTQSLLGGFTAAATAAGASTGNAITIRQSNNAGSGTITSMVKLLQEFGNTRVLSSPKLMALNNQTALLKVVDNIVYFEVQAQTNQTQGAQSQTVNTTAKTVSVGVVMGVTPQVNEDGRVTLIVRPSISRVLRFKDDPNPTLVFAGQRIPNQVPEIQVREMESVLQINSGQTVILGGLMQDDGRFNREQLPGADLLGEAGDLFRFRNESAAKNELVIFLRPTVVTNPSLDSDELKLFQRFLPQAETASKPAAKPAP